MGPEEEVQEGEEDFIKILYSSPWALSIIVVYLSMIIIWILYYRSFRFLPFGFSIVSLMVLLLIIVYIDIPSRPFIDRDSSWIMSVVWVFVVLLISGGGIFIFLIEPFSTWVLAFLFFIGPIILLKLSGNLSLTKIGIRKGNVFVIVIMILLAVGFYVLPIVYSLSTVTLDPLDLVNLTITTTLLPAVFEEIVWRGIVQDRIAAHYQSNVSGILISSLFFGLGHIWTNSSLMDHDLIAGLLLCFFAQFLSGIVFGITYHLTGSVSASIIMHYLHNASVWVQNSLVTKSAFIQILPVQSIIFPPLLIGIVILLLWKSRTTENSE